MSDECEELPDLSEEEREQVRNVRYGAAWLERRLEAQLTRTEEHVLDLEADLQAERDAQYDARQALARISDDVMEEFQPCAEINPQEVRDAFIEKWGGLKERLAQVEQERDMLMDKWRRRWERG